MLTFTVTLCATLCYSVLDLLANDIRLQTCIVQAHEI
jgi:hypothetical protein